MLGTWRESTQGETDNEHMNINILVKIVSPYAAVCNVTNANQSTKLLASTTLRTILGTKTLQVQFYNGQDNGR